MLSACRILLKASTVFSRGLSPLAAAPAKLPKAVSFAPCQNFLASAIVSVSLRVSFTA